MVDLLDASEPSGSHAEGSQLHQRASRLGIRERANPPMKKERDKRGSRSGEVADRYRIDVKKEKEGHVLL